MTASQPRVASSPAALKAAAVAAGLAVFDVRCIQGLFGDAKDAKQGIDGDLRLASDKVENTMVYPAQATLGEQSIRARGKGAIAEE